MLHAYRVHCTRLERLSPGDPLERAQMIDLLRPTPAEVAAVAALGIEVPTLEDMEEIEISTRLYRVDGIDYMTAVLPGRTEDGGNRVSPVTFILAPARIVTVRHHSPRPFETYPQRADKVGPGCAAPDLIFLSLMEEIVGRLADLLEGAGRSLDEVAHAVYAEDARAEAATLQRDIRRAGREGEVVSRIRLSLMTLERMVSYFGQTLVEGQRGQALAHLVKGLMRDLKALEVHADFLSNRVQLVTDAMLGMVNLSQNQTIKIFSVLAVIFLPPTLIASAYGMNFAVMPELAWTWGYPMAIVLMVASAVGTYLVFKWRGWL